MPAAIICTKCNGHLVDVQSWPSTGTAQITCFQCQNTTTLTGFTLGRFSTLPKGLVDYVMHEAMAARAELDGPADHGDRPTRKEVEQAIGAMLADLARRESDPRRRALLEDARSELRGRGLNL
jgi:hypothetical protein